MNSFLVAQTLAIHARFTVFEAVGEDFIPVVLKRCKYREVSEAEFFIRSALMKTKTKVYSQPLLSIFADVDDDTGQPLIVFVWKKGNAWDIEVERDEESQFPRGKAGYGKPKVLWKNPQSKETIKQAMCLTLGKKVVLKTSKNAYIWDMNSVFSEALVKAKCAHLNVCDFLDFRLYQGNSGHYSAYIVMESLEQDLAIEIQERKLRTQPYDEVELAGILKRMAAALLNAESQGLAHQDIKPHNILRSPLGFKLAGFGGTWLKGLPPRTSSAIDTEMYIAPEAWKTMGNPKRLHQLLKSDIFSLGMTMLHLAALKLPERTSAMRPNELQALLQWKVQTLRYSKEFKRLLTAMLRVAPSDRPSLETVQVDAGYIYRQVTQGLAQEAHRLKLQVRSNIREGNNANAIELATAAHAIYSRLCEDRDTAINLNNWGYALNMMGRSAEAVEKYITAHDMLFRLKDEDTANNLNNREYALNNMGRSAEAVSKYEAAHDIYTRPPEDNNIIKSQSSRGFLRMILLCVLVWIWKSWESAIVSLFCIVVWIWISWRAVLDIIGWSAEAMGKYAAAHAIYSRLSDDKNTANNLCNWGAAVNMMGRSAEAVEKYAAAHAIYSRLLEDKYTAGNMYNWGIALRGMGRSAEAVEKHAAAHAFYSRLPEDKYTACNLCNWGIALNMMGRSAEAVEKHVTAHAIYTQFPEDVNTAYNLCSWGIALHTMGRSAEAVEKCEAARAISVLCQLHPCASDCDAKIAMFRLR